MKQNPRFCFTSKKIKNKKQMQITKIIGENGALPQLCGRGACPAAILADNGDVFVQGYVPAPSVSMTRR